MQYRVYLTIPNLPLEPEEAWEPLIETLERDAAELGPVIGWDGDDAHVIVAADAPDPTAATRIAVDALADARQRTGQQDRYSLRVEVEHVAEGDRPVPA